jgi:hypothetical protein
MRASQETLILIFKTQKIMFDIWKRVCESAVGFVALRNWNELIIPNYRQTWATSENRGRSRSGKAPEL